MWNCISGNNERIVKVRDSSSNPKSDIHILVDSALHRLDFKSGFFHKNTMFKS